MTNTMLSHITTAPHPIQSNSLLSCGTSFRRPRGKSIMYSTLTQTPRTQLMQKTCTHAYTHDNLTGRSRHSFSSTQITHNHSLSHTPTHPPITTLQSQQQYLTHLNNIVILFYAILRDSIPTESPTYLDLHFLTQIHCIHNCFHPVSLS